MNNLFICNYFLHPVKLQMRIVSPNPKEEKWMRQSKCTFTKLNWEIFHFDMNYVILNRNLFIIPSNLVCLQTNYCFSSNFGLSSTPTHPPAPYLHSCIFLQIPFLMEAVPCSFQCCGDNVSGKVQLSHE